jgi:bifunctional non-homologous end joining protein LigD
VSACACVPEPRRAGSGGLTNGQIAEKGAPRKTDHAAETIVSFAPLPSWNEPCIPTLVAKPPRVESLASRGQMGRLSDLRYLYAGTATVCTRRGHDWSNKFKPIAAAAALPATTPSSTMRRSCSTPKGARAAPRCRQTLAGSGKAPCSASSTASFSMAAISASSRQRSARGARTIDWPAEERRHPIQRGIRRRRSRIFKIASAHELEGIVSKRVDLPYRSGRSQDWLKVKCVQSDAFVIIQHDIDAGLDVFVLIAELADGGFGAQ